MLTDAEARTVLYRVLKAKGYLPNLAMLQVVGAIARLESGYGGGWKNGPCGPCICDGEGSNNWGAVQCGTEAPCGPRCFVYLDHHADGSPYCGCFRVYDTPEDGASDLVANLFASIDVEAAASRGDARGVADAMHAHGYFESDPSTYAAGIARNAKAIAQNLHEPARVYLRPSIGRVVVVGGGATLLGAAAVWAIERWAR